MKYKKTIVVSLVAIIAAGGVVTIASAKTSTFKGWLNEERKAELDVVFVNKDYDGWKKIVGENAKINEKINKDNFSKFVEMQELMKKAREIKQELGLNEMRKKGKQFKGEFKNELGFNKKQGMRGARMMK